MKIINNYDGASIDIISVDDNSNEVVLSLRKENGMYSNYYNFKVENPSKKEGIIYIRNYNQTLYSNDLYIPFYRTFDGEFIRMDRDKIVKKDDCLAIRIDACEAIEISLYPRYVEEDLERFLDSIKDKKNVKLIGGVIKQIIIGDPKLDVVVITCRLHPGETLSSYFLEGIINKILSDEGNFSNYCYVIFPMVNIEGIRKGNHRYNDDIDYNRIWHIDGSVSEVEFIKKEIEKYNIYIFIDIHGDEISKIDYVRTNDKSLESKISVIKTLADHSKLRRFVRAIVKQRRIIDVSKQTAREYISKKYGCMGLLVELSLIENDIKSSREKGMRFIDELIEGVRNEEKCNDSYKRQRKLK